MPELQEGRYAGEFVVSEGNGRISRETITVLSGETLEAGAVPGKVTASGKYKVLDPAAVDGSEAAQPAAAPEGTSAPQTAAVASTTASADQGPARQQARPAVTDAVTQPTAQVIDLDAVRAEERKATLAYVAEVHELCALAGRGDLAAGFIAKATPVAQVRRALLEARAAADEATAIRSQVRPASVEPAQPAIDTAAIYAARNHNVR